MGSVKTSAIFYYRGVPKTFTDFGKVASGNYAIFQPTRPIFNSPFFSKSISNFISVYR
jgi:hypothetical protein